MGTYIDKIQQVLRRKKVDAFLVTNQENRRYLSGFTAHDTSFTERSGAVLIPARGTPFLLTDFRYKIQAESEAKGFEVILYPHGITSLLCDILPKIECTRLAFEGHAMTHVAATSMTKSLMKIGVSLVSVSGWVEKMRTRKTGREIDLIRRSVALNEAVFREVHGSLCPGITEHEVALQIETLMRSMGAEGPCFATIVAAGPNGALPHATPGERKIEKGEPVVIDMGLVLEGYCSDMTRTVVLGEPDTLTVKLFRLVRKAQLAGIDAIRPGVTGREVDRAARRVISSSGYGKNFGHGLGHGVGLEVHESPRLNKKSRQRLTPGMVITVEPGIYIPGWGGIRLENMVVVTETGCEVLNRDTTFLDI